MRFASILPLFALVSSAFGLSNSIIAARQAHSRRSLIEVDVCAALDVDLKIDGILLDGLPIITGHLDVCLCVSVLPVFIQTNVAARLAALIIGEQEVIAIIKALINSAPGHETCHYPHHSQPICDAHNPCDFHCTDGYERFPADRPTSCICSAPHIECNGQCGDFPNGCGTAAPASRRNVPRCDPGFDVCGVPSGKSRDWECVNTKRDLESCGGCSTLSVVSGDVHASGYDCSAIPHVASVSCEDGKCHVESCLAGFIPSVTADACVEVAVRVGGHIKRNSRAARGHVRAAANAARED